MVVTKREWGKGRDVNQRVQTFIYKINKFLGSISQHGDYSWQYCTMYLKVVNRTDQMFWPEKEMVVMGHYGVVS